MRTKVSPTSPTAAAYFEDAVSASSKLVRSPKPRSNIAAAGGANGGQAANGASHAAEGVAEGEGKNRAKKMKVKNVRYSCEMPETELGTLKELKNRLAGIEIPVKKSELVRVGLMLIAGLPERRIKAEVAKIRGKNKSARK